MEKKLVSLYNLTPVSFTEYVRVGLSVLLLRLLSCISMHQKLQAQAPQPSRLCELTRMAQASARARFTLCLTRDWLAGRPSNLFHVQIQSNKRELGETLAVTPRGLLQRAGHLCGELVVPRPRQTCIVVCKGELGQETQFAIYLYIGDVAQQGGSTLHIACFMQRRSHFDMLHRYVR